MIFNDKALNTYHRVADRTPAKALSQEVFFTWRVLRYKNGINMHSHIVLVETCISDMVYYLKGRK